LPLQRYVPSRGLSHGPSQRETDDSHPYWLTSLYLARSFLLTSLALGEQQQMPLETAPVALRAPDSTSRLSLLPWVAVGALTLSLLSARPGAAQQPVPGQPQQLLQQAQQNPALAEQIRQRIQQSGLTPEQVRARLRASGYPDSLLDAYLAPGGGEGGPARAPGSFELAAIRAVGLPPIDLAPAPLPVDTGMIRSRAAAGPSRVFGVDVFRRSSTQFLPLLSGPVPPDYRIGPGDVIALILTGDVELAYTLQVMREGYLLIPQVGQVHVAGLTLDEVRDVLYARLGRVYSGVRRGPNATTRFDVSVVNVRANQIYVVGEVGQPGAYQISSLGTVLSALYAAGGPSERANLRAVEVRRQGKALATLDLYDYLLRGDTRSDVRLETGDVVFVPVHDTRIEITGAVLRPALYELKPTETLADLVRAAGGFRPDAALKRIAVFRLVPEVSRQAGRPARTVIDVALSPLPAPQGPGRGERGEVRSGEGEGTVIIPRLTLLDGDSVVVDSVPPLNEQYYVAIAGRVEKPGQYPWRVGMTLRDLVLLARGPAVGADLREAEIARLPADRSHGELATTLRVGLDSTYLFGRDSAGRYVGPPGMSFAAGGAPEVTLEPYDNVLIFQQPDFDFQRTVVLLGEVRYPGTYSLKTKGDRLAELVARAGGLTARAYPEGIRFYRAAGAAGRLDIDLPRAMGDAGARDNVVLQPGDSIVIPEFSPSVKVTGAVNSPGSVLWRKGAGLEYYISAAGGFAPRANTGNVSVKFANGRVQTRRWGLFTHSDPKPGPGSEVFVPTKPEQVQTNVLPVLATIAQVMASLVTIIVVAKR
jgi:polysaccharide biosynthesis/export protein